MDTLMKVFDKAIESRLDRRCTFIPTTVMSQVDSSAGDKTGFNHSLGKNLIGTIYQPKSLLIDTDTINTLPDRELASGLAEVIELGLVRDAEFFEWQERNMDVLISRDPNALAYAIKRSCEMKAETVSLDELEGGLRAILNFGHTFGHAIENGKWFHGEAVAAGMRVDNIVEQANLPIGPPESMTLETFRSLMALNKLMGC
ncbi:putative 3-dehydroquinate synthase [Rosa chinensis]|uniref:Putative 3-dehydroquinate synthase n=1 Tax=Rosa chinensis TaxID=74649 RepID=A0A2P6RLR3_ROSCH|nr:putative 3-dehydroquinate synthase [Rosa chinensis]